MKKSQGIYLGRLSGVSVQISMLKKKAAEMKMFWEDDGKRGDMIHGLQVLHSCALPQEIGMRPICMQSSDS